MSDKLIEAIAKVCHEANKAYCETQGDYSQLAWNDAPDWQKMSAISGVKFHLENPKATPSQSHENWMAEKTKDGWSYGNIKNVKTKQHPCYLPYTELPVEQQLKDSLFINIVKVFTNV